MILYVTISVSQKLYVWVVTICLSFFFFCLFLFLRSRIVLRVKEKISICITTQLIVKYFILGVCCMCERVDPLLKFIERNINFIAINNFYLKTQSMGMSSSFFHVSIYFGIFWFKSFNYFHTFSLHNKNILSYSCSNYYHLSE